MAASKSINIIPNFRRHKLFIAVTAIIILVIGLIVGTFLAIRLDSIDLQVVNIALTFTSIILLLIIGGFVVEIKGIVESRKKIMGEKSQAALEFLTTYAWAFLVILIMISALAYFGILSPSRLLPDRCNFGAEIGCDKNRMIIDNAATGTLTMQLKNNFGTAVIVTVGRVTTDFTGVTCTVSLGTGLPYTWQTGTAADLVANCAGGDNLPVGEKTKFNIELDYYAASAGVDYTKTIFGEALSAVQ